MYNIRTRFDNLPKDKGTQVEEEMKRQPDESKANFIKRTVMRCYRKRIAEAELTLMLAECPVRPSNSGLHKGVGGTLINVRDSSVQRGDKQESEHTDDLTDIIKDDAIYDGR